jgi:peptide subunit release factor 1 (eRF1)
MLNDDKIIGILALDSQEAGLGILTGDRWEIIDRMTSGVAGKRDKVANPQGDLNVFEKTNSMNIIIELRIMVLFAAWHYKCHRIEE